MKVSPGPTLFSFYCVLNQLIAKLDCKLDQGIVSDFFEQSQYPNNRSGTTSEHIRV